MLRRIFGVPQAGASIRTAAAAASALPSESLESAFANAMGSALEHLALRTDAGERGAATSLEVALAYAARQEAEGGAAYRVQARPVLVALLKRAEAEFGGCVRRGEASGREAFLETLKRAD